MKTIINPAMAVCMGMTLGLGLFITSASAKESAGFPSLLSSLNIDTTLEFCGEKVPIESHEVRERFEKEFLLSLWDRPQIILWLKRSRRYLPHIEKILADHFLPDDLKYIAVAESALRPHAGSTKGAIGFWQFTKDTGLKYGLVIDEYIDERRNVFASTPAAIAYFKELYNHFKSWTLAAAAFNMGEQGLAAEILEQDTNNYYRLYLPLETQRYVFRILSVKLIFADPEKFGFRLNADEYYSPLIFDRLQVSCIQEIPIRIIAQAGKTYFKQIKDLNPEIRGHYLQKGTHNILVPKGASNGFENRFKNLVSKYLAAKKEKVYIVKNGDNLSLIADRFGVPLAAIIIWNRIDIKRPIHPGDRLIVYGEESKADDSDIKEYEGRSD